MGTKKQYSLLSVRKKFGYAMIAPSFLTLFIMTIYPFTFLIVVSMHRWAIVPSIPRVFVGLNKYIEMFRDTFFHETLRATLIFTAGVVSVELLLGLGLALLLVSIKQRWLRFLFLFPSVTTPIVIGLLWRTLFSYDLGTINYYLSAIGLNPVNWLGTPVNALLSVMI